MLNIDITFYLNTATSALLHAGNHQQVITNVQAYAQKLADAFYADKVVQVYLKLDIQEKNMGNSLEVNGTKIPAASIFPNCPPYIGQEDFLVLQLNESIFLNRQLLVENAFNPDLINATDKDLNNTFHPLGEHISKYLVEYGYHKNRLPLIQNTSHQEPVWKVFETSIAGFEYLQITIYVPEALMACRHAADEFQLPENLSLLQKGLYDELGILIPKPVVKSNDALDPFTFQIYLNDLPYPILHTIDESKFICNAPHNDASFNIDHPAKPNHPKKEGTFSYKNMGEKLDSDGYTWGTWGFLILQVSRVLRTHASFFMNGFAMHTLLDKIYMGPLTKRLLNENYAHEYITHVFRKLSGQGLPIRNVTRLLEGMLYADDAVTSDISAIEFFHHPTVLAAESVTPEKEWENPEQMAEALRNYLRNELEGQISGFESLQVLLLATHVEPYFFQNENYYAYQESFMLALEDELKYISPSTQLHCILTLDPIRHKIENMVKNTYPFLKVVSYGELPPETNIEPVGKIIF